MPLQDGSHGRDPIIRVTERGTGHFPNKANPEIGMIYSKHEKKSGLEEKELHALQKFALSFGLLTKAHTHSISFILPADGTRSAITITPHQNSIKIYFRPHNLGKLADYEQFQIEEILEGKSEIWLTPEQLPELIQKFQDLLNEI